MMWWPFGNRRSREDVALDCAARFAARCWDEFCDTSPLPHNIHLRDRVAFFEEDFRTALDRHFPAFDNETDRLLLIARGIQLSGTHRREHIERGLGIILPA